MGTLLGVSGVSGSLFVLHVQYFIDCFFVSHFCCFTALLKFLCWFGMWSELVIFVRGHVNIICLCGGGVACAVLFL